MLLVLAYRPPDWRARRPRGRAGDCPTSPRLTLGNACPAEAVATLIGRATGEEGSAGVASPALLAQDHGAAPGANPSTSEELLHYLGGLGYRALRTLYARLRGTRPGSMHGLILETHRSGARSGEKTPSKVASVIGRVFAVAWLWGVYPEIGAPAEIEGDLSRLDRRGLTLLDTPPPQLTYLFKHQLSQEVAYGTLPYTLRGQLHGHLAGWSETRTDSPGDTVIDLLAYHYGRSDNPAKQREYYEKAGAAARRAFANEAALAYYERLLPLVAEAEQAPVLLALGQVRQLMASRMLPTTISSNW